MPTPRGRRAAGTATGFLRIGTPDSDRRRSTPRTRRSANQAIAETLAKVVGLGASYGLSDRPAAQCHDHKYDPLSQADHFRFRAFFAAVKPRDDEALDLPPVRQDIERHNAEVDRQVAASEAARESLLGPARKALLDERKAKLPEEVRKLLDVPEEKRDEATKEKLKPILEQLQVKDEDALAGLPEAGRHRAEGLAQEIESLKKSRRSPSLAMAMTDEGRQAPPTHLFFQGDFTQPREEVAPGIPSALDPNPATIETSPAQTTGRRLALARWVASAENPWTARVVVNRLWQGYFGRGLVATPNDFGFSGARPSHPELLDWLATELVDRGWSLKAIHRLIVTSAAYRQASLDDPARRAVDPENRLFWRQEVRRLDADALRDALLAVSGRLLPVGSGPPRWPRVDEEVLEAQPAIYEARHGGDGGRLQDWYTDPDEATDVRSIFLIHKRSVPVPLLAPFDLPDTTTSCARRSTTTVAPQALTLLNNPDAIRLTDAFAARLVGVADPVVGLDGAEDAVRQRDHFQADLVGFQFDEHVVALDRVAGLFRPARHRRLGDGFAEGGGHDVGHLEISSYRVRRLDRPAQPNACSRKACSSLVWRLISPAAVDAVAGRPAYRARRALMSSLARVSSSQGSTKVQPPMFLGSS